MSQNSHMASAGESPGENALPGEGEEDLEKIAEESPWSNLPPPVFSRLLSKLSGSFIHTARQVCPHWLACTEHEIGLRVKIDDTLSGNLDFIRSVKVVQARIVNWRTPEPTLMFPTCLKKMTISGSMPPTWKVRDLEEFPNLYHLVIRGAALHAQDLTGSPLPSSPDEENVFMGLGVNSMYDQYEPPVEASPILLRKLEKLEIIMNEFSYPSGLPLSIRLREPERATVHELYLKRLYLVVQNNVTFFLNNIRSPHLHSCQIYIYPKAGIVPPAKLNWRHKPLQRFLSNHKRTLRDLYLPDFEGKHDETLTDSLASLPNKLKKLQVSLSKFIGDREEGHEQDTAYWKQILIEQTHLVDVYLILSELPSEWIRECLSSFSYSSKESLTYVDVVIDHEEETVQINLEIFTYCHKLQVLKLSGRESEIMVRNFCKLPGSMRKIYISMAMVELPEANLIPKFSHLEMLEMKTIAIGGGGVDQEHRHNRTLEMIHEFLKLRRLSLLSLFFDYPLNPIREVMTLLNLLDPYYHPTHEAFSVKLNISYEMEAGWSEEVFDEERLQIEYINSREPEDYHSWQGRHRNAISVDDEDHRIFVFQTLPFLINLRGTMGGGIRLRNPDGEFDEGIQGDIEDGWDDDERDMDDEPDSDDSTVAAAAADDENDDQY